MKQKVVFACTLCFILCVCGCTAKNAGEIRRTDEESQAYASAEGVVQEDIKTPVENEDTEWPTAEEIKTTIAAKQIEVYWLAGAIQIPEQMNCYTVDALDMEMFWGTLKEKLKNDEGTMGMADKTSRAALRCNVRHLYDPRRTVADGIAELLWIYREYIYVCGYSIYTANNSKLFSTNAGIDNAFPCHDAADLYLCCAAAMGRIYIFAGVCGSGVVRVYWKLGTPAS